MRSLVPLLLSISFAAACGKTEQPTPPDAAAFHIADGSAIVDTEGRSLLLRGVNARIKGVFDVTFDDGRTPLEAIPDFTAADAKQMREWGYNVLRLPINWSGLEPKKDQFSDAYVACVQHIIDLCAAEGVYVLVDFHQDAYSKEIGEDGAPLWAIVPPPAEKLEGPLNDLNDRRTSAETAAAFKSFWDNRDGLQDAFADAVAYVDKAIGNQPFVVGIEIMNEPFYGLDNSKLIPFYLKVIDRVRNPQRLWFFEPNVIRNQTDKMPPSATPFPRKNAVYSPHIYTDVFTLNAQNFASNDPSILEPSMRAASSEAYAWHTPLFVGEFGISPWEVNAYNWYTAEINLQNKYLAHSTFWVWKEESQGSWGLFTNDNGKWTPREDVVRGVTSPFPQQLKGTLLSLSFDRTTTTATASVELKGTTVTWGVPSLWFPKGAQAFCDAAAATVVSEQTGRLTVDCPLATQKLKLQPK